VRWRGGYEGFSRGPRLSPLLSIRFLQTQPDARLLALAQAGNERAFEALVRRYRRQLLGYCRRIGSPTASAEDALQQTFLQAWVALSAGREVRDVRAWLYRIAHNVVISSVRQQTAAPTPLDARSAAQGVDDEAEQRLAVREALAGLASLPGLQREVMVGAAVDGLTHAEIARELGLSSGAVRGLIYRARSTLRLVAGLFVPAPLLHWAARQGGGPSSASRIYEAVAGGGSAGMGGLLLKGGVITATAGVLATAAGVVEHHAARHPARAAPRVLVTTGGRHVRTHSGAPVRSGAAPATTAVEVAAVSSSHAARGSAPGGATPALHARSQPNAPASAAPSAVLRPRAPEMASRQGSARGSEHHSGPPQGDARGDGGRDGGRDAQSSTGGSASNDGPAPTTDGGGDGQFSATTDQPSRDGSRDSSQSDGSGYAVTGWRSSTTS
jgi:RNA polymerase sigma factor (sigma-70 family)